MSKDLSWEKMKTFYVPLYTETFNQEEIDSLIIFYESPTGKMVISKVPLVMNKTMTIMQQLMQIEMLRIEAAYNEALEEAVSLNKQTVK